MTWKVDYYQTERGDSPVVDFLDSLSEKARAKCLTYIDLLEEHGSSLTRNYVSKVTDDIWELRPEFGGTEYRFFYFMFVKDNLVILSAITKKTQQLKPRDIALAQSRATEVQRREAEREQAIQKAIKDNVDPGSVQITPAIRRRTDRG